MIKKVIPWLAVLAFAACSNAFSPVGQKTQEGAGFVTVTLNYSAPRTLMPSTPVFTRYTLLFASAGKADVKADFPEGQTLGPVALEPGNWSITVSGYQNLTVKGAVQEFLAAAGTGSVTINAGTAAAPVSITLRPAAISANPVPEQTGVFTYAITNDAALPGANVSGGFSLNSKNGEFSYRVSFPSLPAEGSIEVIAGEYDLSLLLTNSAGMKAGRYTAVHVYAGLETKTVNTADLSFIFGTDDFAETVLLAGTLAVAKPAALDLDASDNVTISAWYDEDCVSQEAAWASYTWGTGTWTSDTQQWYLDLPAGPSFPPVYLKAEIAADDGKGLFTYVQKTKIPETGITENGRAGIPLSISIFSITEYSDPGHGYVSASRNAAVAGSVIDLTVSAETSYYLKPGSFLLNGGAVTAIPAGGNYQFTMPENDVTASAVFLSHVTLSGTLEITKPAGVTLAESDTVSISAYSDPGHTLPIAGAVFASVWGDDGSYIAGSWDLPVPVNTPLAYLAVTVTADDGPGETSFAGERKIPVTGILYDDIGGISLEIAIYGISVSGASGGTITASRDSLPRNAAVPGGTIVLEAAADSGYHFEEGSFAVNSGAVPVILSGGVYSFAMPAEDVTVTGAFLPDAVSVSGDLFIPAVPLGVNLEGGEVTITAYTDKGRYEQAGSPFTGIWTTGGISWELTDIPAGTAALYITVEVTEDDGSYTYIFNAPAVTGIDPVTGESNVIFTMPVYGITGYSDTDGAVTTDRPAANPGEKIELVISPEAGYELAPGTLKVNGESGLVFYSDGAYYFFMPEDNAIIEAEFEVI